MTFAALLGVEIVGAALMWTGVPLAWFLVGREIGAATGSLGASAGIAFLGFVATVVVMARVLQRIDDRWVRLRRAAGHKRAQGPLQHVIVVSMTFGILGFVVWYYLLSEAYVLPFMPSGG
jgi:hypothetical protein